MLWAAPADVGGLVDFAYGLTVPPAPPPVAADGRAGLIWLSDGTVRAFGPQARPWRPARSGVDVVGLRLSLGAVPAVFGVPAGSLADRHVCLGELWSVDAAEALGEQMLSAAGPQDRARLLFDAVRGRTADLPAPDPFVSAVVHGLQRPGVHVSGLAEQVGLSERHLRRRCEAVFGYPPSVLGRLLRLQRFFRLARGRSARSYGLAALAYQAGYADQSHLSRDCRSLSGLPPSRFLS